MGAEAIAFLNNAKFVPKIRLVVLPGSFRMELELQGVIPLSMMCGIHHYQQDFHLQSVREFVMGIFLRFSTFFDLFYQSEFCTHINRKNGTLASEID
nr:hypothetical protein [uncultured Desulfobacter sp.]